MNYKLYKLIFKSPVHFGSDSVGTSLEEADLICHSDTFFSSLCLECIKLNGDEYLKTKFKNLFDNGDLLISSLFPYKYNDFYIPKPIILKKTDGEEAVKKIDIDKIDKNEQYDRKAMKKISYINISHIDKYLIGISNNDNSFLDFLNSEKKYDYNDFAEYNLVQKVGIRADKNNSLYSVGAYHFYNNSGLYFILAYNNNENLKLFENILKSLQYSGIGGKRTSGYGLFKYEEVKDDTIKMFKFENKDKTNYKMLLSLYSPIDEEKNINELNDIELKKSYYSLIKRNGFIYSTTYSSNLLKRKSLCMFKEGSCFYNAYNISGNIINVGCKDDKENESKDKKNNRHNEVYRYGKALYIGINFN